MQALASKLTYANVVSSLALFLALTGGVVWAAGQIHSKDIAKRAVKTQKIATHAVTRRTIAGNSIGSVKIRDGSILPQDLAGGGTMLEAKLAGGRVPVTNNPSDYPLAPDSWTQKAGESNAVFARISGAFASDGGGPCNAFVQLSDASDPDFRGGIQAETAPTTLEHHSFGDGAAVITARDSDVTHHLTAQVSGLNCTPESTIDSVQVYVYAFG